MAAEISWRTQVGLSVLWTLYAAGALAWGFLRAAPAAARYGALALLGLTVVKVFLVDLSAVRTAYRILSFLILGVVLLLVSLLYQKARGPGAAPPPSAEATGGSGGSHMHIDLGGKVAIVTGAGPGIGREIAEPSPARASRPSSPTSARSTWTRWPRTSPRGAGAGGSIAATSATPAHSRGSWTRSRAFGRIDILVNNAGVALGGPVEDLSEEAWDLNHDINLKGTFLMCRAVIPIMKRQRWGRILNAASFAAIVPIVGGAAYAASKAGVHFFTRALAGELGPWNVTVNCYAPGMIPTEMNHFAEAPPERQQRLLDTLTLRRWGDAQDVANLVVLPRLRPRRLHHGHPDRRERRQARHADPAAGVGGGGGHGRRHARVAPAGPHRQRERSPREVAASQMACATEIII